MMGTKVGRAAVFGIPLQQQWSYGNTGDFAPTYYLADRRAALLLLLHGRRHRDGLPVVDAAEQARLDPMITGFNPTDMYAADHMRRVLTTFPGVFSGIGEFTIHKEFVSSKIAGETASLRQSGARSPARFRRRGRARRASCTTTSTRRFRSRGRNPIRSCSCAICSCDIRRRRSSGRTSASAASFGRSKDQLAIIDRVLSNPALNHLYIDLSWDETAKYIVASAGNGRGDGGSDQPPSRRVPVRLRRSRASEQAGVLKVYGMYAPLFARLPPMPASRSAKGTTCASSTKPDGESAPGNRPTSSEGNSHDFS